MNYSYLNNRRFSCDNDEENTWYKIVDVRGSTCTLIPSNSKLIETFSLEEILNNIKQKCWKWTNVIILESTYQRLKNLFI